jgi:hypothetical protein
VSFNLDNSILTKFEEGLDPLHPERSAIPASILGYGEISTVFRINHPGFEKYALKRLPIFENDAQVEKYEALYKEYNRVFNENMGILTPGYDGVMVRTRDSRLVYYDVQEILIKESIGSNAIHILPDAEVKTLVLLALRQLAIVWDFNGKNGDALKIGIDGQISNWAIVDFDPARPGITGKDRLLYLDTSTPMIRRNGVEQLDTELFLKSTPSFLRWLVRLAFLQEVLGRYYDFRLVVIDMIANFFKEQKKELIPSLIKVANDFFSGEASRFGTSPITDKEVEAYYKNDAFIWRTFLALKKLDRFLTTRILRRRYELILPEHIKR